MSSKWWRIKVDWIITSHDRLLTRLIALHVVVSSFWTISTISAGLFLVNDNENITTLIPDNYWWNSPCISLYFSDQVIQLWCHIKGRSFTACLILNFAISHLSVKGRKWSHQPKYSPTTPNPKQSFGKDFLEINNMYWIETCRLYMPAHLQQPWSW